MNPAPQPVPKSPEPVTPAKGSYLILLALLALVIVLLAAAAGLLPRLKAKRELADMQRELAVPNVVVTTPSPGKAPTSLAFPAEIRPRMEAPIYARATGYLKYWKVDIGDKVESGQLLAEIDSPEVDQDLQRAQAELQQVEAALALARTTSARWMELLKTASVSAQEAAEKQADLTLKTASIEAARANVRRLEELKGFTKITAPFAGTITARMTDVGQLVNATNGKELFRLADMHTLRVFVRVPQSLSRAIVAGQTADIALAELPKRKFTAKVVRTSGAIDSSSRTLLTELELDNASGEVLAGSYVQVKFTDANPDAAMTVPSHALLFQADGPQVGVVGNDDKVIVRRVRLGRDFGPTVEVLDGLSLTDRVILNPSDSLNSGLSVHVSEPVKTAGGK